MRKTFNSVLTVHQLCINKIKHPRAVNQRRVNGSRPGTTPGMYDVTVTSHSPLVEEAMFGLQQAGAGCDVTDADTESPVHQEV